MSDSLSALAHAKVNLVLEVLGKRPDGYHEIDTILQEVELADRVSLTPADDWGVSVTGPCASGTPEDESNLALKAALLLAERVPNARPYAIHLEKHIPAAGGLGGGASDAAAVLRLLGEKWDASADDITTVANAVGSDEAFFLAGGTARAGGRGETVTALPALPPHDVVVFVPRETIERKTARMFAQLSKHPFDDGRVARALADRLPCRVDSRDVYNAFERVAFDLFPWLAELWRDLERRTGEPVRLAGAGPCLFWIGPEGEGDRIGSAAAGSSCAVIPTRTVQRP